MFRRLVLFCLLALAARGDAVKHVIAVGANKTLTFNPSSVTAAVGDSLEFHFYSGTGAHSVVSSTFDTPCTPASNAFFSGYVTGDSAGTPTFTVDITSTDPIWFYCSLAEHCGSGMAGVVNPPQGETLAQYIAAAGNRAASSPSAVTGGILATGGATATTGASTSVSSVSVSVATTTTGTNSTISSVPGVSAATTLPTTSASKNSSKSSGSSVASTASTTTTSSSSGGVAATTTPSAAGRSQDVSVMLGLVPILGGLVALMA